MSHIAVPVTLVGVSTGVVGQVAANGDLGSIIFGGGTAGVIALLFWGLMQFSRGRIQSRDVAVELAELKVLNDRLARIAEESLEREGQYRAVVDRLLSQVAGPP